MTNWSVLGPQLLTSIGETLYMVVVTMIIAGFLGLVFGVALYVTRPGGGPLEPRAPGADAGGDLVSERFDYVITLCGSLTKA